MRFVELRYRRHPRALGLLVTLALTLCGGNSSLAQTSEPIPTPGRVLQDWQQKTMPTQLRPDVREVSPEASRLEGEPDETQSTDVVRDSQAAEKFFVGSIRLEGVTLLRPEKVAAVVAPYENRELSFAELQTLADALSRLYREDGYVTSRVLIPPQKMTGETVTLQAVEGRMGKINVGEGQFFKSRSVRPQLSLKSGEPFNVRILKRDLRRLNTNPDRTVGAALKPGEQTGETDVFLELEEQTPVHITPSFDNLGRRLIGVNRFGLQAEHNNILGLGDSVMTSLSFTRQSFGVVTHYQLPLGSHGTTIGFDHAYSRLKLGGEFKDLNVQGKAVAYSPFISQELLNRKNTRVTLDVAFDFKELDTDILDLDFSHDSLRILRPALSLEQYDKTGRTFFRHEFSIGLDGLGGTTGDEPLASRAGAGSKFFSYTGALIRTQKLPFSSFGIVRLLGQATPDRLVSAQQFQLGGAFSVRGYIEGQAIGDKGFLASVEVRTPLALIPETWKIPQTQYSLRRNIQLVGFADYGAVFTNKPLPGANPRDFLLGVGVGIRAQLTRHLVGRVDWGFPLLELPGNSRPRLHFGIQSNIF